MRRPLSCISSWRLKKCRRERPALHARDVAARFPVADVEVGSLTIFQKFHDNPFDLRSGSLACRLNPVADGPGFAQEGEGQEAGWKRRAAELPAIPGVNEDRSRGAQHPVPAWRTISKEQPPFLADLELLEAGPARSGAPSRFAHHRMAVARTQAGLAYFPGECIGKAEEVKDRHTCSSIRGCGKFGSNHKSRHRKTHRQFGRFRRSKGSWT